MGLQEIVQQTLKGAIREQDEIKRNAVRLLLTAMKNKEKELRRQLTEEEITQAISSQIKQRRESVEQYLQASRPDLADQEEKEIQVLQSFLPEPLADAELERLIAGVISETGAQSAKDMGMVMKAIMPLVSGRADGKRVSEVVRQKLR
jgi:uncharacterized protein YqeY